MKTHYHTGVTLSVKSQQGLLTPEAKKANHREYDLHKSLIEIAKVIQPDLTIVDGITSMEGEGPTQGHRKRTKVLVYGDNPYETDLACCEFMGISPSQIKHLDHAVKEGLVQPESVVQGDAFQKNRVDFQLPSPKPKKILNFYSILLRNQVDIHKITGFDSTPCKNCPCFFTYNFFNIIS